MHWKNKPVIVHSSISFNVREYRAYPTSASGLYRREGDKIWVDAKFYIGLTIGFLLQLILKQNHYSQMHFNWLFSGKTAYCMVCFEVQKFYNIVSLP